MRISARTDYAVRAMAELAGSPDRPLKSEDIATRQDIPLRFLFVVLSELRRAGLVRSLRGPDGGYELSRPPEEITLADVIRAVDGPLASVRDLRLTGLEYPGAAAALPDVWRAVRTSLRQVLEGTTLADLAAGTLPRLVAERVQEYNDNVRAYPPFPTRR
ncbi:Rrf2 family transcriptional regulator [Streptomyces sp. LX-29]|uniref:RrF2 family transcriptional regulator n=1 Tax=Streptomyces sp. LX-29 TaxID=2900152 RepID=UPI00240D59B5|nr:Rrf2 family transcriptional regulator [Streptomyces sp. LX-29]WFB06367.1 Rrf2 family transcriptional regulator [Streptomyces sp. LX-29]